MTKTTTRAREYSGTTGRPSVCFHLALNVSGCGLGVFELLHQRNISEEITPGRREPIQQIVLQPLEFNLEAVLLHGQLHLGKNVKV